MGGDGDHQGDKHHLDDRGVDEHAQDQNGNVNDQQEDIRVVGHAQDHVGHANGDLLTGCDVVDAGGRSNDQRADTYAADSFLNNLNQILPAQHFVAKDCHQQRVQAGYSACFGGGHDTCVDARQQQHGGEKRRQGTQGVGRKLPQGYAGAARIIAGSGYESYIKHQGNGHENGGNDATHEQRTYRSARIHGIDDHRDRRGKCGAQHGGGGCHGAGEAIIIAFLAHGLDLHFAQAAGIGDGGTCHACKYQRAQDVYLPQAAAEPADQAQRKAVDLFCYLACVHDVGSKDKQRHRYDGVVGVEGFERLLRHHFDRIARHDEIEDAGC